MQCSECGSIWCLYTCGLPQHTHTHFDVIYGEDRQSVLCIHKYYSAILLLLILDITCGYMLRSASYLNERERTAFPNRKHARKRTRTHGGLFGIWPMFVKLDVHRHTHTRLVRIILKLRSGYCAVCVCVCVSLQYYIVTNKCILW